MEEYSVNQYRLRYVVPFEFEEENFDFENEINEANSKLAAIGWEPAPVIPKFDKTGKKVETDVYYHIIREFDPEKGSAWNKDIEKRMGLYWQNTKLASDPKRILMIGASKDTDMPYPNILIDINDAGLYIFRTGIGLLWYEVSLQKLVHEGEGYTIDDDEKFMSRTLCYFQYLFKEFNRFKLLYEIDGEPKRTDDGKPLYIVGEKARLLGNWVCDLLDPLYDKISFISQRRNIFWDDEPRPEGLRRNVPDKAHLFSCVVFDYDADHEYSEDALRTAYYLSNGYKESYKMSSQYESLARRPFDNVIWSASREGCGYYAWPTGKGNETDEPFFCGKKHSDKVVNDYFTMYIRVLYISCSLFRYARFASAYTNIPCDIKRYADDEETEKINDNIKKLSLKINIFLTKSILTSVSHIQHQNEFYSYLMERLNVEEDIKSVNMGLDALNEMSARMVEDKRRKVQEEDDRAERKSESRFQAGLGLMTFLAFFSAVADSLGIIAFFTQSGEWPAYALGVKIIGAVMLALCVVTCFIALRVSVPMIREVLSSRDKDKKGQTK